MNRSATLRIDSSAPMNTATSNIPSNAMSTMRMRSLGERLVIMKLSTITTMAQNANWPQAPRENVRNSAGQHHQQQHAAADHLRSPSHQDALKDHDRRQHQEGAEHVGIVEGATGAVVEQEHFGKAAEQMEVAGRSPRLKRSMQPTR